MLRLDRAGTLPPARLWRPSMHGNTKITQGYKTAASHIESGSSKPSTFTRQVQHPGGIHSRDGEDRHRLPGCARVSAIRPRTLVSNAGGSAPELRAGVEIAMTISQHAQKAESAASLVQ